MRIVVIGAGVIGASIAEVLAVRGAEVIVLDMRAPGVGATRASAGMLAPYTEAQGDDRLLDISLRSLAMFDSLTARLSDASGRAIEYSRLGTLQVALDEHAASRLKALGEEVQRRGAACEWLTSSELRGFDPNVTASALGGLFIGAHGLIGVASLMHELVDHARFSGATFEYPVEVVRVDSRKTGVEVRSGDRRYEADAAVLAAGSWARRVRVANLPQFPVRPVRGQLLHLEWADSSPPARIVWGPGCYCVPWSDRSLLVGATVEDVGFDEHSTVEGVQGLMAAVSELLPAAAHARVEEIRVGLRPALPDLLPGVGPLTGAPHVVAAIGHYRHGVLLAPFTAEVVSRCLLDGVSDPAFALTSPNRLWSRHDNQ